jgi:hypothetical protein
MKRSALLSLLFAVLAAALFLLDFTGYFSRLKTSIATLSESRGNVRQLRSQEWSWNRVFTGTNIGNQDLISTSDESYAQIRFAKGGEIYIAPNTTLMISEEREGFELKVLTESGRVRVNKELAKKIVAAKPSRDLASQESKIDFIDESESLEILQKEAALKLKEENEIRDLSKALQQNEVDNFAKLPPTPELVSPAPAEKWESETPKDVSFDWRLPASAQSEGSEKLQYEILIRGPKKSYSVPAKKIGHVIKNLKAGRYEWSVRALSSTASLKSAVPDFRSFEIAEPVKLRQDNFFFYPVEVE